MSRGISWGERNFMRDQRREAQPDLEVFSRQVREAREACIAAKAALTDEESRALLLIQHPRVKAFLEARERFERAEAARQYAIESANRDG